MFRCIMEWWLLFILCHARSLPCFWRVKSCRAISSHVVDFVAQHCVVIQLSFFLLLFRSPRAYPTVLLYSASQNTKKPRVGKPFNGHRHSMAIHEAAVGMYWSSIFISHFLSELKLELFCIHVFSELKLHFLNWCFLNFDWLNFTTWLFCSFLHWLSQGFLIWYARVIRLTVIFSISFLAFIFAFGLRLSHLQSSPLPDDPFSCMLT